MFGRKRLAALESQFAAFKTELSPRIEAMGAALEGHAAWLHAVAQGLTDIGTAHGARLDELTQSLEPIRQAIAPLSQLAPALAALETKTAHAAESFSQAQAGHAAWLLALDAGLSDLRAAHSAELRDIGRWLASTTQAISSISSTPVISSPELQAMAPKAQRLDERTTLARMVKIWSVMRWLAQAPVEVAALISVIVPTRNRRGLLERAVASVLAQTYPKFDLVIIDDGSTDETSEFLASLTDLRIRSFRTTGIGTSAARNLGLDNAIGDIITHLDDDNLMDPGWLHAVAWGFARWPETKLLYGARIIEDGPARHGAPSGAMPMLEWQEFNRARLEHNNYIDMNVIAHRAHLPEARFDPQLRSSIEWDMLLKLTARYMPLELPVLACLYSNYAPNRLSDQITYLQENQLVRARTHVSRALRVLSYNAMFPLLSETYIEEEMLALEAMGAAIAFAAFQQSVSPYPVRQPVYHGLDEAVAAHDPDVIIVYWASHALGELAHIARTGRPFALRVHSFDFNLDDIARLKNHSSCLGVWAFPHHAAAIPGAHDLVPIFTTHATMPPPGPPRTTISSISAGLPKKDWPLLLDAMAQLSEFDREIVLARSNGFEDLPDEVAALAGQISHPPAIHINLPRQEVFRLLRKTSVLIYTVTSGLPLGMPMSVIEALYAGACVITPDSPEMKALCGDGYRPYRNATDIVAHAREIMQGGNTIEAERKRNHETACAAFCRPELGRIFHDELSAALTSWRLARQRG
jgi:glycosyltransferase involved in cell wall biosynthesis